VIQPKFGSHSYPVVKERWKHVSPSNLLEGAGIVHKGDQYRYSHLSDEDCSLEFGFDQYLNKIAVWYFK